MTFDEYIEQIREAVRIFTTTSGAVPRHVVVDDLRNRPQAETTNENNVDTATENEAANVPVNTETETETTDTQRGFKFGYPVPSIKIFRPTWDEFKDFNKYISYIESVGAHEAGICKIIPPPEWVPRKKGYNIDQIHLKIKKPIAQHVAETKTKGIYEQLNEKRRKTSVKQFNKNATSDANETPPHRDHEDLERIYWEKILKGAPVYGTDVSASLTDGGCTSWNINKLNSILDYVVLDYKYTIYGVTNSYLYFGMWKTSFAWHTEDMDLYSINYVHFGAPKTWYAIPPKHGRRFENLVNKHIPASKNCPAYLRHKVTLISPEVLKENKIPFDVVTQEAREIIITFPYGYHAGFNHGFNCAESTNFATERWINYGKKVQHCVCQKDMFHINMDTFVRRFQPEKYEDWKMGVDTDAHHPEEPFATD